MIKKYTIVEGRLDTIAERIQKHIDKGWQPYKRLIVVSPEESIFFLAIQPMVKYNKKLQRNWIVSDGKDHLSVEVVQ